MPASWCVLKLMRGLLMLANCRLTVGESQSLPCASWRWVGVLLLWPTDCAHLRYPMQKLPAAPASSCIHVGCVSSCMQLIRRHELTHPAPAAGSQLSPSPPNCSWRGASLTPVHDVVLHLCVLQIIFALIAFAAAASLYNTHGYKYSFVQFMVFTGVMGFLIAIFYAIVHCVEGLRRTFSGVVEVFVSALWVIFWLAAAASFAAYMPCKYKDADMGDISKCDLFLASQAFGWLSWLLWMGSLLFAIIDMRQGEGLTGGGCTVVSSRCLISLRGML